MYVFIHPILQTVYLNDTLSCKVCYPRTPCAVICMFPEHSEQCSMYGSGSPCTVQCTMYNSGSPCTVRCIVSGSPCTLLLFYCTIEKIIYNCYLDKVLYIISMEGFFLSMGLFSFPFFLYFGGI